MQRSTYLLVAFVFLMLAATIVTRVTHGIDNQHLQPRLTHFAIDINTADAATLAVLPAVGPSLAHRIVDYRAAHRGFRRVEDLLSVSGIGERTLQRLLPYVKCDAAR